MFSLDLYQLKSKKKISNSRPSSKNVSQFGSAVSFTILFVSNVRIQSLPIKKDVPEGILMNFYVNITNRTSNL